jgi:protein O-mannosyl-transferase
MDKKEFNQPSFLSKVIIICAIIGLPLIAYWGIADHQFINFDDNVYVVANYHVKYGFSLENIKWAFGFTDVSYWHPLTNISHMLDCQIFGVKAGSHLLVNLVLHISNALLLFLIILRMTGARFKAALIALLFAIHPLNVESVAWVAERKTLLSALFLMVALYFYIIYTEKKKIWKYVVIMCLYALGLMSKPIILIFPFLLLVLDYWPLQRFQGWDPGRPVRLSDLRHPVKKFMALCKSNNGIIVLEKVPFGILSLLSLYISMLSVLKYKFLINYQAVPIDLRIENLFTSIIQYLRNLAWPVELSIYYPFPKSISTWYFFLALVSIVLVTFIIFKMRKKHPWLITGWFWFLIALLPASGLIQAGLWPAMANRFMYLPLMGIFIMLIWEGDESIKGRYSQPLKAILCAVLLIYLVSLTRFQNLYFSNSYVLFNRCLEVVGDNDTAFNRIGDALAALGRNEEAMLWYAKSMKYEPRSAIAYNNYGVLLFNKGDDQNARPYFQQAIKLDPNLIVAYVQLGLIESRRGNGDEAIKFVEKAFQIDQDDLNVQSAFGTILLKQGRIPEAIQRFLFVVKRDPGNIPDRINLAQAYEETGLNNEALSEYETLQKLIDKNKGYIYYRMAGIYSEQNKLKDCVDYLEAAWKDRFNVPEYLTSDVRFKNFRKTPAYRAFLENHKMKIKD